MTQQNALEEQSKMREDLKVAADKFDFKQIDYMLYAQYSYNLGRDWLRHLLKYLLHK